LKLSQNANNLAEYVEYQSERTGPKTAEDLANPDEWNFVDLDTISQITAAETKTVNTTVENTPAIDESIQELEKSLKKSIWLYRGRLTLSGSEEAGLGTIR
jgi:hypothetical protein